MSSKNHSYCSTEITLELGKLEGFRPFIELTLDIDQGLTPDISVYKEGNLKPDFYEDELKVKELPSLAIEVTSPTQGMHELLKKAKRFREAGIPAVWIVDLPGQVVIVFDGDQRKSIHKAPVESEGITVDFKKVFA